MLWSIRPVASHMSALPCPASKRGPYYPLGDTPEHGLKPVQLRACNVGLQTVYGVRETIKHNQMHKIVPLVDQSIACVALEYARHDA